MSATLAELRVSRRNSTSSSEHAVPTFEQLEEIVGEEIPDDKVLFWLATPWAWWVAWVGAATAIATVYLWEWLGLEPLTALKWAMGGLYVEIGGFLISFAISLIRAWPNLKKRRLSFARELDVTTGQVGRVIDWLRQYPDSDRQAMLRYVTRVKEGMTYRMGVLIGGVDKLGMLPLVLALYFQLKDLRPGGMGVLLDMNAPAGICLLLLILIYIGGWWLVLHKTQLDGYEGFLTESLAKSDEASR